MQSKLTFKVEVNLEHPEEFIKKHDIWQLLIGACDNDFLDVIETSLKYSREQLETDFGHKDETELALADEVAVTGYVCGFEHDIVEA